MKARQGVTAMLAGVALVALVVLLPRGASAQKLGEPFAGPPEPVSTVNATYVDPSSTTPLKPGDKVNHLFRRNMTQLYVLQRLTKRTYWVQHEHYSSPIGHDILRSTRGSLPYSATNVV
jgi:hypothetical protein